MLYGCWAYRFSGFRGWLRGALLLSNGLCYGLLLGGVRRGQRWCGRAACVPLAFDLLNKKEQGKKAHIHMHNVVQILDFMLLEVMHKAIYIYIQCGR